MISCSLAVVSSGDLFGYLGILLAAAVPWFELFVIPGGIAMGLSPVGVGVVALVGNGAVTVATIFGYQQLSVWWEKRRGRPLAAGSGRSARGRQAFERFGVPGLALQGPMLTGIYLAVVLAMGLGASRRSVLVWSLISLALWSAVLATTAAAGLDLIGF